MSALGSLYGANPILVGVTSAIIAAAAFTWCWNRWSEAANEREQADRDDFYDWDDQ